MDGGGDGTMAAAAVKPARTMRTAQVAQTLGLSPRAIAISTRRPGCPFDRVKRGKNEQYLFDLEEYKAWRLTQGLEADRRALFNAASGEESAGGGEPPAAVVVDPPPAAAALAAPVAPAASTAAASLCEDTASIIEAAKREIARTLETMRTTQGADVLGLAAKLTGAIKQLVTADSQLQEERRAAEDREGRVIDRGLVTASLGQVLSLVVSMMEGWRYAVGPEIARGLAENGVEVANPELFERACGLAVVRTLDEARRRAVAQMVSCCRELLGEEAPELAGLALPTPAPAPSPSAAQERTA